MGTGAVENLDSGFCAGYRTRSAFRVSVSAGWMTLSQSSSGALFERRTGALGVELSDDRVLEAEELSLLRLRSGRLTSLLDDRLLDVDPRHELVLLQLAD